MKPGLNNYDASLCLSVLSKQQIITSIPRRFSTQLKEAGFPISSNSRLEKTFSNFTTQDFELHMIF